MICDLFVYHRHLSGPGTGRHARPLPNASPLRDAETLTLNRGTLWKAHLGVTVVTGDLLESLSNRSSRP